MDKQMIEEMARIIAFDLCPNRRIHANYGEEAQCYSDNNFAECKEIKNVVDKLYNAGYRKINENTVLLTKEEFDQLTDKKLRSIGIIIDETRKETAEKFAERLKEELENCSPIAGYDLEDLELDGETIQECIDEICEEFAEGKE